MGGSVEGMDETEQDAVPWPLGGYLSRHGGSLMRL